MLRRSFMFAAVAALSMASTGCTVTVRDGGGANNPGRDGWVRLGSRIVNFGGDRDVIRVTARRGRFNALRLKVTGSPLEMDRMVVTFGNGKRWSPNLRQVFKQGSWSRVIDLPGNNRVVTQVAFHYRSVGKRSGRATVRLAGRR